MEMNDSKRNDGIPNTASNEDQPSSRGGVHNASNSASNYADDHSSKIDMTTTAPHADHDTRVEGMKNSSVIYPNGSDSVGNVDVSRISLTDDTTRVENLNPVSTVDQNQKQAWDENAIKDVKSGESGEDMYGINRGANCPFFLKEIDISNEILKSDPEEKKCKKMHSPSWDSQKSSTGIPAPLQDEMKVEGKRKKSTGNKKKKGKERNNSVVEKPGNNVMENVFVPLQRKTTSSISLPSIGTRYSADLISRELSFGDGYASNIRVVVRVRPLLSSEKQDSIRNCIQFTGDGGIQVEGSAGQTKAFTFNSVLTDKCTQQEVFQESGIKELIDKALDGFSCTAFAFGATGSGKTHTIIGPSEQSIEDMVNNQDMCGLLVRSFGYIFAAAEERCPISYTIRASFLEVYNEKVKDLLNPSNSYHSLPVRWSSKKGFYVENLFLVECETQEDLMMLLIEGSAYRQVGVQAINEHSSRSHTIFSVYLESEQLEEDDEEGYPIAHHGKISFVDLAGSERVKETKASGDSLTEANNINRSLLILGNCISALGDPKKKGSHIPYRDSKLTKLLADSLGGEGFTLMIACVSPSLSQETMNTLRYANRAKDIKIKPILKLDPKEQLMHRLKREIKLLRAENDYFRQQQGVPYSESQVIFTPNDIEGELTPNESGTLSPAIGSGSTLSSLQSSRNNSSKELNLSLALFTSGGKIGLYDILQEYMKENESLKAENIALHRSRALAHRQQEELFRENERVKRKLEELGRAMLSTPLSRENIRTWINKEKQDCEIFTHTTGSAETKSKSIHLPPVRKGSYPNYIYDADYEKQIENIQDEFWDMRSNGESSSTLSIKNPEQPPKEIVAEKQVKMSKLLLKRNKEDIKETFDEQVQNDEPKENKKINVVKGKVKGARRSRKNIQPQPWKIKKKPASVDKPSGYAAQFAARKGYQIPKHAELPLDSTPPPDLYQYGDNQFGPYPSQPLLASSLSSYIKTAPVYQPRYPVYPYVGSMPSTQLSGIPINAYENMANQLKQDLETLNGQLRTDKTYKHPRPR